MANRSDTVLAGLSERQLAAIYCVMDGLDDRAGAARMGITVNSYRTHLRRACVKLGIGGVKKRWIYLRVHGGYHALPPDARISR